jgi:hypothetical protein
LALADERQGEVGEWRKIPRRTDRPLPGNHWKQTPVQHLDQALNDDRTHARMTLGEGPGAEQQHGAHGTVAETVPDAGGMAPQQADLEAGSLIGLDVSSRQAPEPGCDPVDGSALSDDLFNKASGRGHSLRDARPDRDGGAAVGDVDNVGDLQWSPIDGYDPQPGPPRLAIPAEH